MNCFSKLKILFVLLTLLISSCVSKKKLILVQDLTDYDISKVTSSQTTLQENDILKIDVTSLELKASIPYNKVQPQGLASNSLALLQLNGYLVSKNKTINFPVLGEISVAGKTAKDLEMYLKNLLESGGHLIEPKVTVRLINSKFTILGEVGNQGTYSFTEKNITLLQALGMAGGLTIDGDRKNVTIIRESNGQRTSINLDLTSASFLVSPYQNIQPNDVIIINPNPKKVKSAGLVGDIPTVLRIVSVLLSTIILIR